jgi:HAMP domain-containing protein
MDARELEEQLRQSVGEGALADSLVRQIDDINELAAEVGAAALDPNLFAEGGQAFLWEDLLSLEDAKRLLGGILNPMDVATQAKILLKLVLFWRKLREVRVGLDKNQYLTLKAVKGGAHSVEAIAANLNRRVEEIRQVVDSLKAKRYRGDVPLLEEKDGALSTRF